MQAKEALPPLREDHHGVIPYTGGPNLALYQIERELTELLEARAQAEEEGALPAEIEVIDKTIAEYFAREVKKVDGICHALQVFSDAEDVARREAKRLTERADAHRAKFDRIKAATLKAMQDHGVRVLETPTNKLRVQGNGGLEPLNCDPDVIASRWVDFTVKIPADLWFIIRDQIEDNRLKAIDQAADVQPNGDRVRAALKRGEQVPGAELLPRGVHLRVE